MKSFDHVLCQHVKPMRNHECLQNHIDMIELAFCCVVSEMGDKLATHRKV